MCARQFFICQTLHAIKLRPSLDRISHAPRTALPSQPCTLACPCSYPNVGLVPWTFQVSDISLRSMTEPSVLSVKLSKILRTSSYQLVSESELLPSVYHSPLVSR